MNADSVLTAGFWTEAGVYDPYLEAIPDIPSLENWMGRAGSADEAFITFARRFEALKHSGDLVSRVEASGEFEKVAEIPGLEDRNFTHFVFRLKKPGPQSAP